MNRLQHAFGLVLVALIIGCAPPMASKGGKDKGDAEESKSIIGQKTQEVGEFDAKAGRKIATSDVHNATNPITGALKAYGPAISKIAKMQVDQALRLFQAEHGRFPKDHAEFMERVIKEKQIMLPKLPGGDEYQYDVENHQLIIVDGKKADGK